MKRVLADDPFFGARRTYRIGPTTIAFVVDVDHDVLRGSGRPLPRATAVALGVQPGDKVTFAGSPGDVVVSWPLSSMMGPAIGSLRSHALNLQLVDGDRLRVIFDTAERTVTSVGVTTSELAVLPPAQRAAALTGIEGLGGDNVTAAIAAAVDSPVQTLRRALAARGDEDLLALLPTDSPSPELDDALTNLARKRPRQLGMSKQRTLPP